MDRLVFVNWNDVKKDMKYSNDDDNNDYDFGVEIQDDDGNILDVMWFKTERDRMEVIRTDIIKDGSVIYV